MKKVFSSHREVAHIWAQQNKEEGRACNVFFKGTKIYSYGKHFVIANFVKPNVVLFNSENYSISTSKHQTYVLRAIPNNVRVFNVPDVDGYGHFRNIEFFLTSIRNSVYDAKRSLKYTDSCMLRAYRLRNEMHEYIAEFEVKTELPADILGDLNNHHYHGVVIGEFTQVMRVARLKK